MAESILDIGETVVLSSNCNWHGLFNGTLFATSERLVFVVVIPVRDPNCT